MLFKKFLRTAKNYKAQFISMIVMITLGIGIFLGFNMEWRTIEYDTYLFFEETEYADFRLYSEKGFTTEEANEIANIPGVNAATRFFSVNLDIDDSENKSLAIDVSENYSVSAFKIIKGSDYDKSGDGIWLSDKFAEVNKIAIGDNLSLTYQGIRISGRIVGLIKATEHMICLADSNQLMPDYSSFGYAYISPAKLRTALIEKAENDAYERLVKSGLPAEEAQKQAKNLIDDKAVSEMLNSVFTQIHIRSDLQKTQLEDLVKEKLGKTVMLVPKTDHVVYKEAMGEAEEGKTMGSILPVLFLAIAILTMITTMHRIATKEKTQIGILKALGFNNNRILVHYSLYGLIIGLIGAIFGSALGFGVCKLIMSENGMMGTYFDMPYWGAAVPWFCYPVVVGTVLLLFAISFLSVKAQLSGNAAETLRPYTPKKVRKTALEKFKPIAKSSFKVKWNMRDLLRHKSRVLTTLIGIVGCMILIVGGLGMKDTMSGFLDLLDNGISHYATKINLVENADEQKSKALAEDLNGDWDSLFGISIDGYTATLCVSHYDNGLMSVVDENNKAIDLSDDGAYLCLRLKDRAKIGEYLEFSPYGSDKTYSVKVAGYYRSIMTEGITVTDAYADKLGIDYNISEIFTNANSKDTPYSDIIAGKQDKAQLMDTFISFVQIMDSMVIILVIAAIILGIVVLYNLGIMSYLERGRELATLKVLGFDSKTISGLLIAQNVWLTIVGVIIGLPAGVGVLSWLLKALASEYELKLMLGPLTYSVSILVTFGVSIFVGLLVAKKNKKIDMVEALKAGE